MTKLRIDYYDFMPLNKIESQYGFDFNIFCRFADCVRPYNQQLSVFIIYAPSAFLPAVFCFILI